MVNRFYNYFPWLLVLGDIFIILIAIVLSKAFYLQFFGEYLNSDDSYFGLIILWIILFIFRKDYKIGRTSGYSVTLKHLGASIVWLFAIISIFWVAFQAYHLSRLMLFTIICFMLVLLSTYRVAVHMALRKYRSRGKNFKNAIIIGRGTACKMMAELLQTRKDYGINLLGYFDDFSIVNNAFGIKFGLFERFGFNEVDLVYISGDLKDVDIKHIIDFADEYCIKVKIIPSTTFNLRKNLSFTDYGEFSVINVNEIPLDLILNKVTKRSFDLIFSLLVILFILSWMIPLIGILIKLESKGSIFFLQNRNGENNKVFRCVKFRSMRANDLADTVQAQKNDPRVTKVGAFLRRTSLDEMPQFLNVFMGEMSIVGPRPHTVPMNLLFKQNISKYNSRHKIKPGITGLAQVKGYRGEIDKPHQIRSRVKLDYFYIRNWSMRMDVSIMLRTLHVLIFNTREKVY